MKEKLAKLQRGAYGGSESGSRVYYAYDKQDRVKEMISEMQYRHQRNSRSRITDSNNEDDEIEIKVLRRINEEVSELVDANRHLQTRCALLEAEVDPENNSLEAINFFNLLQDKIEKIITFLIQQEMLQSMP